MLLELDDNMMMHLNFLSDLYLIKEGVKKIEIEK